MELHRLKEIPDIDFKRSLETWEVQSLHNKWMNDVGSWMTPDCLQQYNDLIQEAEELEKGKGKGNAGKLAKGTKKGENKGKAGKPAGAKHGPRQQAQQLKKQRFNKIISDLAANKGFFMCLLRHPCVVTVEGITHLLEELAEVKNSKEYCDMLHVS